MLRILPFALLTACVVRYGDPQTDMTAQATRSGEPLPPPIDFSEVDKRLETLLLEAEDIDKRDRLQEARGLARRVRDEDPRAQRIVLLYLQELVAIEERDEPVEAPEIYAGEKPSFIIEGQIVEEEIPEEAPTEGVAEAIPPIADEADPPPQDTEIDVAALLKEATTAEEAGRTADALLLLERCRRAPCWKEVEGRWASTRDAFVHHEREQSGVLYLRARNEADPSRRLEALTAIRQRLADLVDRYPDTVYADDIRRNLDLVQRSIESTAQILTRQTKEAAEPGEVEVDGGGEASRLDGP